VKEQTVIQLYYYYIVSWTTLLSLPTLYRWLMAIRSHQEGTAGCDAAADDSRDGMTLNKEQLTALSLLLL